MRLIRTTMKKLKRNTASQQAHQQDHVFNTQGHSVTPSSFDGASMRCHDGEIWERLGFSGGRY